jgi:4-amino-4-deoxy-L-arabinose transferase-like glycosyltransferase
MSEGRVAFRLSPGREIALALVIVSGLLCLFVDKAFSIDDPLFVWLAKHLSVAPFDFYGYQVNWGAGVAPMHLVTKNPPLAGYFLAAAGGLLGWSEVALHLAFLIPAGAVVLATYGIAERLCSRPLEATLIATLSPVFLISSTNLMSDTLMLAFWCGSVYCWMRGIDGERWRWLLAGVVLAALAVLTKYYAVSLVPLLLAYGLLRGRALGQLVPPLLIPVAAAIGFELLTQAMYGTGLISEATRFALDPTHARSGGAARRLLIGLVFAGGCLIPVLFYAPLLWSRRALLGGLASLGLALLLAPHSHEWAGIRFAAGAGGGGLLGLQLFVFALAGVSLLALVGSDLRSRGDAGSWLLVLWVLGTLAFATLVNWTNNGRSNLPMAPAVGILLVRCLDRRVLSGWRTPPGRRLLALLPAALVAVAATWADYRWANEVRAAAARVEEEVIAPGHPTRFFGHWGIQYYLEEAGARSLDFRRHRVEPGDFLVVPGNNYLVPAEIDPGAATLMVEYVHPEPSWIRTLSPSLGAGFYDSDIGPMPYSFGRADPDVYRVYRADKRMRLSVAE